MRNEEWILHQNLQVLSNVCVVIIVGDQNSTDRTAEICVSFPKVRRIESSVFTPHTPDAPNRRQWLLDAARDYDGNNVILAVDADEILTATVLQNQDWLSCLDSLDPGDALELQWIWLWGTPHQYIARESIWADRWTQFVFRDDRQTNYSVGNIHEPRVPQELWSRARRFESVKVMHDARMAPHRQKSRQYYIIIEELFKGNDRTEINQRYPITREDQPMVLEPLPDSWVERWLEIGIDLQNFNDPPLNWFDVEILALFNRHGTRRFADLNIWDIDWEYKRQLALSEGIRDVQSDPIKDPRTWEQVLYHRYLNRYIKTPVWRQPKRLILPLWNFAQKIGGKT